MELRRFLLIITLSIIAILLITVWFFPLNDDFRTGNPFWNGSQDISARHQITPLESLSALPVSPPGATLILIPYLEFTRAELGMLHNFVTRGGTLILADDYGYGNQVLEYLKIPLRFSGETLLDPLSHYKNKWFPRILHLTPGPLTSNVTSLVFNRATAINGAEGNGTIALSSSFSFLDQNSNHIRDEEEPVGPFPVISHCQSGNGQVILITDPSIFINSMESMEDNHILLRNIRSFTTSGLFIDESHLPPSTLYQTKRMLAHVRDFFTQPLSTTGVVIAVLAIILRPIWRKPANNLS